MTNFRREAIRAAYTLLELILVVAILGTLIALLLPAVARVRESARLASSQNNLKQLALACHNYADANGGRLPHNDPLNTYTYHQSVFGKISHYAEIDVSMSRQGPVIVDRQSKLFISPGDPTFALHDPGCAPGNLNWRHSDLTSYSYNSLVFRDLDWRHDYRIQSRQPRSMTASIPDGLSNTILLGETYAQCDRTRNRWPEPGDHIDLRRPAPESPKGRYEMVSHGQPPVTSLMVVAGYSFEQLTFQSRPCTLLRWDETEFTNSACGLRSTCEKDLFQTPFSAGLPVALADGSVRVVRPTIAPAVFWGAMTPNGGEIPGDF